MGELANAMRMMGSLPLNVVNQNPNGTWSFVGRVDARLLWVEKDGSAPTPERVALARNHGAGLIGLKYRVWPTKEDALAALAALPA